MKLFFLIFILQYVFIIQCDSFFISLFNPNWFGFGGNAQTSEPQNNNPIEIATQTPMPLSPEASDPLLTNHFGLPFQGPQPIPIPISMPNSPQTDNNLIQNPLRRIGEMKVTDVPINSTVPITDSPKTLGSTVAADTSYTTDKFIDTTTKFTIYTDSDISTETPSPTPVYVHSTTIPVDLTTTESVTTESMTTESVATESVTTESVTTESVTTESTTTESTTTELENPSLNHFLYKSDYAKQLNQMYYNSNVFKSHP